MRERSCVHEGAAAAIFFSFASGSVHAEKTSQPSHSPATAQPANDNVGWDTIRSLRRAHRYDDDIMFSWKHIRTCRASAGAVNVARCLSLLSSPDCTAGIACDVWSNIFVICATLMYISTLLYEYSIGKTSDDDRRWRPNAYANMFVSVKGWTLGSKKRQRNGNWCNFIHESNFHRQYGSEGVPDVGRAFVCVWLMCDCKHRWSVYF